MRKSRSIAALALAAAAALTLSACNSGSPADPGGDGGNGGGESTALWEVAKDVKLDGSPTFETASSAGKIRIGVKNDQPGLGFEDQTTGERTGFDVDMARWVAASLGFDETQIEWKTIPSANREQELENGNIDLYVGTYSITDKRKTQIDFAGPYFITGQGLLVGKDDDSIKGPEDLAGKTVCSVTGSTPLQRIRDEYSPGDTIEYDTYTQCVEALVNGSVDAITTDQAILAGYVAQQPDEVKLAGAPFSEERYGIGLKKGDTVLKDFINKLLNDDTTVWDGLYKKYLEPVGVEATKPTADE